MEILPYPDIIRERGRAERTSGLCLGHRHGVFLHQLHKTDLIGEVDLLPRGQRMMFLVRVTPASFVFSRSRSSFGVEIFQNQNHCRVRKFCIEYQREECMEYSVENPYGYKDRC